MANFDFCSIYSNSRNCTEHIINNMISAVGPENVGIDASSPEFQHFGSGIFRYSNCTVSDDTVIIAGFGNDRISGFDFWLIRNSCGES